MFTGNWNNKISKNEYLILYQNMDSYGHPTGTEAVKKFDKKANVQANSDKKEKLSQTN
jgi:hypothetical protein